ncbi:hypothetical protein HaLaN_10302 [Haematococcus lacustris]|uniref:Uncharacterized protein n=1 Tax=Haematococcus lacustris TaxID=44745 RepID=A0A699YVK3_HAELA|nr:hypothetical protein HaLaN_10302 [Haematococcus lacustris]
MATLTALGLKRQGYNVAGLYTFGSPRGCGLVDSQLPVRKRRRRCAPGTAHAFAMHPKAALSTPVVSLATSCYTAMFRCSGKCTLALLQYAVQHACWARVCCAAGAGCRLCAHPLHSADSLELH